MPLITTKGLLSEPLPTHLRQQGVFVPNSKIVKETLINYHSILYRRVDLDVTICYEDDLACARDLMVELMKGGRACAGKARAHADSVSSGPPISRQVSHPFMECGPLGVIGDRVHVPAERLSMRKIKDVLQLKHEASCGNKG
ncbi:hypothetical protein DFAR_630025 [Desulfarculales bacterium]